MTDTAPPNQWSPVVAQNTDLDHPCRSRATPPRTLPGSLPVPTIQGDINNDKMLSEYGDSAPSLRGLGEGDGAKLNNKGQSAEYFVFLTS